MHENHLQRLVNPEKGPKEITAEEIAAAVTPLKEGQRLPTPAEIQKMKQYAINYKKSHPRAKMREIERAVMKRYNIILVD